jgi:signal transduction histidine kinase
MRSPIRAARSSVRVRITVAATVVVGLTIAVAGWALVRSVERSLESSVADQGRQQIAFVSSQLIAGVPANEVRAGPSTGFVQVLDASGHVVSAGDASSPAVFGGEVIGGSVSGGPGGSVSGSGAPVGAVIESVLASGSGAKQVNVPVDGPSAGKASVVPLDVRFQTFTINGDALTVVAASPLADVERSISTLKSALVVGLPCLVALVGLVAWLVVGRALRPVETIRAEVESISSSTMHRRVREPGGRDEVDRLARTMNAMLDRLEVGATRQRRFVADASHELRSPIAAIRTQLEVAQRHAGPDDWPAVATAVLAEEARLEGLVTDLLALALDDEGAPPPSALVDLVAVVAEEADRARRVPVTVDAGDGAVVLGDRSALRSAVAHLLDNGARHARTTVEAAVTVDAGQVELVVDDDGAGIALEDRERVFERFTRLDEGRSRDRGGAGLGLAVVRAVARRHGGDSTVTESPLGGARVSVSLPVHTVAR